MIVDADPQYNLTGTVLDFDGVDELVDFYLSNPYLNISDCLNRCSRDLGRSHCQWLSCCCACLITSVGICRSRRDARIASKLCHSRCLDGGYINDRKKDMRQCNNVEL